MPHNKTISTVNIALTTIFDELDTWFDKPDDVRSFMPSPDEWSIDENLEHITLTSHFLLKVIRKGVARAIKRAQNQPITEIESNLEIVEPVGIADSYYWHRPEHTIPTGEKPIAEVRLLNA